MASTTEVEYVQDYLGIAHGTDDTLIGRFIDAVKPAIVNICGLDVFDVKADWTEEYSNDSYLRDELQLRHVPVVSITSVKQTVDRDWDTCEAEDPDDYTFDPQTGILQLIGIKFIRGYQCIQVIYEGGSEEIDDDVLMAMSMSVALLYNRAKSHADGIKSERLGEYSVTYGDSAGQQKGLDALVPETARAFLMKYTAGRV